MHILYLFWFIYDIPKQPEDAGFSEICQALNPVS